jgi:glycosyltransferase involved in cell wall biosynthesis
VRICLTPRVGTGGPASFQTRLIAAFERLGVETTFDLASRPVEAVLVFSGTRELNLLRRCRQDGIRIVQRLDGINWLHRVSPRPIRTFLRAEGFNLLLRLIRGLLADRIIYQSRFSREWWEEWFGIPRIDASVVYNGIPVEEFPDRNETHDGTLLVVEGHIPHNRYIRELMAGANRLLVARGPLKRMQIMGSMDSAWVGELSAWEPRPKATGLRPYAEVKIAQSKASIFLSVEPNPPCPNAVLEAMAAGLPVIGLNTGSLAELVGKGGELAECDGNPWRLDVPRNLDGVGEAARQVLANWPVYSRSAQAEVRTRFDILQTAKAYLRVLTE